MSEQPAIQKFASVEQADATLPDCPRKCIMCVSGRGHHWYLDFSEESAPDGEEYAEHASVVCGHCEQRAAIHIDAEDMPVI